ncbi:MAG: glycosyltransferase, partial [Actinomycetota bacterium]
AGSGTGIAPRRFSPLVPGDEARRRLGLENVAGLIIGFVGRLTNDKGVGDLLRAFDIVRSDHPGARLVLVGAPEDGDRLPIEATERIARGDGVVSTGWLDDPVPLLTGFDVLAFPSYREGLPNVPLEAQLSGVPVVGYAATGTVDAVDDGRSGLLVSVGDVAGLAESLTSMTDDAVRRRMGDHGRRWVTANFSQQRIWSELLDVYRPQPLAGARTDGAAS